MGNNYSLTASLYEAPMPQLHSKPGNNIGYELRLVWYALLHVEIWPIYSNEVRLILEEFGEPMVSSKIGSQMAKLVEVGYFTRRRIQNAYSYKPTQKFYNIRQRFQKQTLKEEP